MREESGGGCGHKVGEWSNHIYGGWKKLLRECWAKMKPLITSLSQFYFLSLYY